LIGDVDVALSCIGHAAPGVIISSAQAGIGRDFSPGYRGCGVHVFFMVLMIDIFFMFELLGQLS
jgi:hypothetical protein